MLDCVEYMERTLRPRWRDEAGGHVYTPRVISPVFPLGEGVQKRGRLTSGLIHYVDAAVLRNDSVPRDSSAP